MTKLALLVTVLAACSDPPSHMMVGGCDGIVRTDPEQPGVHVAVGTPIDWSMNPPDTGEHYPVWAGWDREYTSLDRGYYVHNAEHGGIVLLYNCSPDCPDVVDALRAVARNMAPDPSCLPPVTKRVIIAADPLLPQGVQVAAVSWAHAYTASCFDPYVETFARDHYNQAPEDLCTDGSDLGGTLIGP